MASTTFVDRRTPIMADWLNDVNTYVYNNIINAKLYGATGNGSTDDTVAIQAALDAAGSGAVYLPPGNYVTTATLNLNVSGQQLLGSGRSGCTILANFRGSAVIKITASRCSVTDLAISSLAGSTRRTASAFGKTAPDATVDGNSEDYGILFQEGTSVMTFSHLARLEITSQPADGIVWYGAIWCGTMRCGACSPGIRPAAAASRRAPWRGDR